MLELTRKYQFHAARKLTSLPDSHPCSKIHGHTFSVIIKLNGEIDESKGWVIDFSDIDEIYHNEVQSILDHQYLNDLEYLSNPTTEHLTIWIWKKLAPHLKGLSQVTVSDSNDSSCTYKGNQ